MTVAGVHYAVCVLCAKIPIISRQTGLFIVETVRATCIGSYDAVFRLYANIYIYFPMPPHVLMNFRGFPPGCGDSVADF